MYIHTSTLRHGALQLRAFLAKGLRGCSIRPSAGLRGRQQGPARYINLGEKKRKVQNGLISGVARLEYARLAPAGMVGITRG